MKRRSYRLSPFGWVIIAALALDGLIIWAIIKGCVQNALAQQ